MSILKYFLILMILITLFPLTHGDRVEIRKVERKTIAEMSDPKSPSYCPFPYPKNRKEIIADLEHAIKVLWVGKERELTAFENVMINLLEKDGKYRIGRIVKVKLLTAYAADDYDWLILIRDKKNEIVARTTLHADGLFGSGMHTQWAAENCKSDFPNSPRRGPHHLVTSTDILNFLTHALDRPVKMSEIKTMTRIALYGDLGNGLVPSWEITFKNGEIYYYSEAWHTVYKISKRISLVKKEGRGRYTIWDLLPNLRRGKRTEHFVDTLHDELIVFDAVKRLEVDF